ncbi:MAG: NifU N-terminal domain-containing protein [Candidatus Pacebacteria bacterium]|nr:NifU N-terminal domain-containing protein [Candidatus Paceibacterota bacterium]
MKKVFNFFSIFFSLKTEDVKRPPKIVIEEHPNEDYLSFHILKETTHRSFMRGRLYDSFRDKQALEIIHPIESIQGVIRVWIRREKILTITIVKAPFVDWADMKPLIIEAIKKAFDLDEVEVEDASSKGSFDTKIRRLYLKEFDLTL